MELQPVSRQMSLLPAEHDNDDLAAAPPLAPPESATFYVERSSIPETAGVVALIATAAALGVWFIAFVHSKLASQENSYTQLWLLFTLMAPLTYMYNIAFRRAVLLYEKVFWVRVELDSMKGKALYNAVSFAIEEVAEGRNDTASADMLGTAEFDRKMGRTLVNLSYWSSRPKTVRLQIRDAQLQRRKLRVEFECGADIVCGRDNSVQNRGSLVLRLAASGDLLADKVILRQWLNDCLTAYQAPANDVVEVIALDESSKDWVLEWQVRSVWPMKRTDGMGHAFFLKRSCSVELLSDACTWFGQTVRCYLITGPPGTGKTELTIWLAGYLKLPLYRLSLNDSRLTDQLFAQLVSPTGMSHDNVVLQIDEFQETLQRWESSRDNQGVSMGGFCEVLQGSNSLTRGFIILSGTQQLERTMRNLKFAAVFRRVAVTTTLSSLSTEDIQHFFCHFIGEFVPTCPREILKHWADVFTSDVSPWGSSTVTIDMVKQFLMKRISSFRAQYLKDQKLAPNSPCLVPKDIWDAFAEHLTDRKSAQVFLAVYPPVHEVRAQSDCDDPGTNSVPSMDDGANSF